MKPRDLVQNTWITVNGENEDEYYNEGDEHDNLDHWYRTDAGYPDAAGVETIDYDERVRRAAAPLRGPQTKADLFSGPTDFVSAARKAAQAAAAAATEHTQNNKAYEKLSVPSFPKSGEMTNWVLLPGYCDCRLRVLWR